MNKIHYRITQMLFVSVFFISILGSCSNESPAVKQNDPETVCFRLNRNGNTAEYNLIINGDSVSGTAFYILKQNDSTTCVFDGVKISDNEYKCVFSCSYAGAKEERTEYMKIEEYQLFFKRKELYEPEGELIDCPEK